MNGMCGLGKLGAVVGTQVLPVLLDLGLSYVLGACLVTCVAGALLTRGVGPRRETGAGGGRGRGGGIGCSVLWGVEVL